jgi:hypothetical protein
MVDSLTITRSEGPVLLFHLAGRLDAQTHGELLNAARQAYEEGCRSLLIDLQNIQMITSAGLGALHQIFKLFTPIEEIKAWEEKQPGEPYKSPYFKLAAASPNVYYVLNIAGFLQNIPIYPDVTGALESFAG